MTAPDDATADALATRLVEERLAACASVLPGIRSTYRWRGEVQRADEVLLLLKTTEERVAALIARGAELHPNEVPEILALPVDAGSAVYLDWVRAESRPDSA